MISPRHNAADSRYLLRLCELIYKPASARKKVLSEIRNREKRGEETPLFPCIKTMREILFCSLKKKKPLCDISQVRGSKRFQRNSLRNATSSQQFYRTRRGKAIIYIISPGTSRKKFLSSPAFSSSRRVHGVYKLNYQRPPSSGSPRAHSSAFCTLLSSSGTNAYKYVRAHTRRDACSRMCCVR